MLKRRPKLYFIIFFVLAIVTAIVVFYGASRIINEEKGARELKLERANRIAAEELRESLTTYATLLSGIKSYVEATGTIPDKEALKDFLNYQLGDLEMDPPFSITFVDTSHIIVYNQVFGQKEEFLLSGSPMEPLIGKLGIAKMNSLMRKESFYASNPTNLLEGEVGLPLGFGILDEEGNSKGYMTSVASFAPIVDRVYHIVDKEIYVLSFQSGNGNYFDRTRSYNNQKVYTTEQDTEFFKNFEIPPEEFVYSELTFYNNTFTIGTAFKEPYNFSAWVYICLLYTSPSPRDRG